MPDDSIPSFTLLIMNPPVVIVMMKQFLHSYVFLFMVILRLLRMIILRIIIVGDRL
ncbi:hypothetical protein RhiirA1_418364 [Rhizophagus irregularis]|uniref:Uncharacterized protein n=1 Tax=Rhizophagus irregularis TaxID=588596 RepID=A0A2N0RV83_9GLOM|nr:hypothetical protein RhiirA1_418364 [Rhizophagus irregularis]